MKKALLLLVFLSGAVAAFFLAMDAGDPPLELTRDAERFDPADRDSPAEDLTGFAGPSGAEEEATPGGAREALAGAAGKSGRPLVIQVWAGRQGVPASGAEVFFSELASGRWGNWRRRTTATDHWSEVAIQKGQRFVTDSAGRVSVPPVAESAMITARRPGEYGFTMVRRKHKPVEELTLALDETIRVRVVDGEGRAVVGVPIGVQQVVPVRPRSRNNRGQERLELMRRMLRNQGTQPELRLRITQELERVDARSREAKRKSKAAPQPIQTRLDLRARQVTDAKGEAVVAHFQLFRRNPEKWWAAEHADRYQVSLMIPVLRPVSMPFAGRPVPDETIELVMPPTGSVVVRVVDHEGRPFAHAANAELRVQGDGVPEWTRVPARKEQDADGIVFPFVGVGLRLIPRVWLDDRDFTWNAAVTPGPGEAGQRITIDVPVPNTFGILRGRLLDNTGKPLTGIRPTFLINGRAGRLEGEDLPLDPQGRFQLTFQVGKRHQPPFSLEIRQPKAQPPHGLVLRLPTLRDGQTIDLGDLTIDAFDAFAGGVVTDDRRQPIVGAVVKLQRERLVGSKTPKPQWRDVTYVTGRTDAQGRFELFANPLPGRFRVSVTARSHFPTQSADVIRGAKVDFTMVRTASMLGSLLLPDWLPSRSVRIRVESASDPKFRREEGVRDRNGKKSLLVRWLRPDIYSVKLLVTGFADPLLRVDGVRIEAGQQGAHPQLTNLDLTSLLYRYEISAVDQNGQASLKPSGPLLAEVLRLDGKREFVGFPWNGNKVEIFSASPQMQVVQLHTGYRVRRTVVSHGASQLQFDKLPPVRLSLPGARQLVGPEMTVRVSMVLTSPTGFPESLSARDQRSGKRRSYSRAQLSKSSGAWLGPTDVVSVPLMMEGEYQVVMRLRGTNVPSVPIELGKVKVAFPNGTPPSVSVPVDAAKVRVGLEKVARLKLERERKKEQANGRKR